MGLQAPMIRTSTLCGQNNTPKTHCPCRFDHCNVLLSDRQIYHSVCAPCSQVSDKEPGSDADVLLGDDRDSPLGKTLSSHSAKWGLICHETQKKYEGSQIISNQARLRGLQKLPEYVVAATSYYIPPTIDDQDDLLYLGSNCDDLQTPDLLSALRIKTGPRSLAPEDTLAELAMIYKARMGRGDP
jgi:hypothetical protein